MTDKPTFREAWANWITVAFLDPICAPVLKRVNRAMLGLVKQIAAYNAKRGQR